MVSRAEVERREPLRAVHRVKARVYSRQGVRVLLAGFVQTTVVDAETQLSVFLPNQDDVRRPSADSWFYDALLQHQLHLFPDGLKMRLPNWGMRSSINPMFRDPVCLILCSLTDRLPRNSWSNFLS